jgi:hypothetical protein
MGFTLRSFLLPKGTRAVSTRMSPPAVSPSGVTSTRGAGPARSAAASGFSPFRESLATWQSVNPPARWILPWVLASQGPPSMTSPGPSPGLLSRASLTRRLLAWPAGAPEYRSAFDPPLQLMMPKHPRERPPSQALCTSSIPNVQARNSPGYGFTSHRVVHCCRPADALG